MQPVHRRRSINASDVLAGSAGRASSTREASTEGNAGVTLPSSQAGGVSETGGGRVWGHLQEGTATTQRVTGGVHAVCKHVSREGPAFCSKLGPQGPEGGWGRDTAPTSARVTPDQQHTGGFTHRKCADPSSQPHDLSSGQPHLQIRTVRHRDPK